ncbi:MAG: anhydro-N-acetylmuramic acid kinase [Cyanobacteria bacterium P01_E01_bin.45]
MPNWTDRHWTHDWSHCQPLNVVGAMSGTSMDGIDIACVTIHPTGEVHHPLALEVSATGSVSYSDSLHKTIFDIAAGEPLSLPELSRVDTAIAAAFAGAIAEIAHSNRSNTASDLVGSHGQTVFHRAPVTGENGIQLGHSIQLGRGEQIAALTGIPTVSNFRAADIALNGHGAPLVPRVDTLLLQDRREHRCIQNIGGIGNVTYLPPSSPSKDGMPHSQIIGWDTGPGNVLIDLIVTRLSNGELEFDKDGQWAAQGTPDIELVERWMQADFFREPPPKSTGRELFSPSYLDRCWHDCSARALPAADIVATLTDFTAASIVDSYNAFLPIPPERVAICGGGARNSYLMQRLQERLGHTPVVSTQALGVDPDFKEAIAFAVLAYLRVHHIPGNLPSVTGASDWCLLGDIYAGQMNQFPAQ